MRQRSLRRKFLGSNLSSLHSLCTCLPILSSFGASLSCQGLCLKKEKQKPKHKGLYILSFQKGKKGGIKRIRSKSLCNCFNHNSINSLGTTTKCVGACLFVRAFLNSSSAASAATGARSQMQQLVFVFNLQKPNHHCDHELSCTSQQDQATC